MKKKLICLALSVVMLLGILPITSFAAGETTASILEYKGTNEKDWYTIGTETELNYFITYVQTKQASNYEVKACNVRLIADIDYTAADADAAAVTAGPTSEYSHWYGTFDGQNHTITGLKTALFCDLGNKANANTTTVIKDVTLIGSSIATRHYDSLFVMDVWNGNVTLQNCHVKNATVIDDNTNTNSARVGGLIGTIWGRDGMTLTVENCSVTDTTMTIDNVSGAVPIGGFVGFMRSNNTTQRTYTFRNCVSDVDITVDNSSTGSYAAGFIGGSLSSEDANNKNVTLNFINCVNYGDITFNKRPVAGITAISAGNVNLTNCANFGNLTGAGAFGLVAELKSDRASLSMENCLNAGQLTASGEAFSSISGEPNVKVGGLTAYLAWKNPASFKNSYDVTDALAIPKTSAVSLTATYNGEDVFKGNTTSGWTPDNYGTWAEKDPADVQGYAAATTLQGWDFGTTWMITSGYPVHISQFKATAKDQSANKIVYEGLQMTAVNNNETVEDKTDDTFNVRFVATINEDTFANVAQKIGFEIVMIEQGKEAVGLTKSSYTVYKSLIGFEDGQQKVYSAEDLGGDYLTAIAVNNVTANGTVTMIVRPFVLNKAGETLAGTPVVSVYTNGELVSQYAY